MNKVLHQVMLITLKDLRIEARGRQTLSLIAVMGVLIVAVLGLGLGPGRQVTGADATAILWVAYLFGGVLSFEKTMAVEREDGALAALLMAPVDRGVIYLAKLLGNLVLMLGLAVVITPVAILLFGFDLSAAPLDFAAVMVISMIGFAAVGTLFAAAVASTRLQGGLLALLVFPVTLPLVIASTQLLVAVFRDGEPLGGLGLGILVAFDAVFLVVSWLVFETILEP
jgi:heme exporter protein CcmB